VVAAEMMELEVSELIGAERGARGSRDASQRLSGAALGHATGELELQIPKVRQGSYFRASWSRAGAQSRRSSRWSSRPMSAVSQRAASTNWWRASGCASHVRRSAASARRWMSMSRRSGPGRLRAATPTCSSTPRSRRSETAAASSTRRSSSPTACIRPGGARSSQSTSARPRPKRSGRSSCAAWSPAGWSACSSPSVTRTPG
jgi:Transposase, Mutator family